MTIDRRLARELAAMGAEDQRMRKQLMKDRRDGGSPSAEQSMAMGRIDARRAAVGLESLGEYAKGFTRRKSATKP